MRPRDVKTSEQDLGWMKLDYTAARFRKCSFPPLQTHRHVAVHMFIFVHVHIYIYILIYCT